MTEVLFSCCNQSLLSILKHRTVDKTVERCELSVVEGIEPGEEDENRDTLESKLIVRLFCKHGCFSPLILSKNILKWNFVQALSKLTDYC